MAAYVRLKENPGENMQNKDDLRTRDQRDQHSLPGTNQAGKGPSSSEQHDREKQPSEGEADTSEQLDEHSLPGTNQAGTGPGSSQKEDRTGS